MADLLPRSFEKVDDDLSPRTLQDYRRIVEKRPNVDELYRSPSVAPVEGPPHVLPSSPAHSSETSGTSPCAVCRKARELSALGRCQYALLCGRRICAERHERKVTAGDRIDQFEQLLTGQPGRQQYQRDIADCVSYVVRVLGYAHNRQLLHQNVVSLGIPRLSAFCFGFAAMHRSEGDRYKVNVHFTQTPNGTATEKFNVRCMRNT